MKRVLPLLLLGGCSAAEQAHEKPNFVILFVDDLGWADLGYQNPMFDSPNINQLKEEGLYLSRAYVSTATSSPSRASLLTGKEALRCGFVRHIYGDAYSAEGVAEFETFDKDPGKMKSRAWLPLEEITYAERLKENGYYTFFAGKWHLGPVEYFPDKQGFDEVWGTNQHGHPKNYYYPFFSDNNPFPDSKDGDYLTDLVTDGIEKFILEYDKDQPFLINTWYYTVHGPCRGKKELLAKYKKRGFEGKQIDCAAMVEVLDNSVGRIRAALKTKGLDKNTVIIFTSDQGGQFVNGPLSGGKQGGRTLCEGGSRIPMIIYAPGMKGMGTTWDQPVQTLDIFPTLVEMASGKPCKDKQINGVSLTPLMNGQPMENRDLFMHRSYEDQNSCIMNGDWKLIKYRSGHLELYNIKEDIGEQNNLVDVEKERTQKMLKRLNEWQEEATPKYLLPEA
ncbi:MAG: sulfatase [Rikenellaceae bacterium]